MANDKISLNLELVAKQALTSLKQVQNNTNKIDKSLEKVNKKSFSGLGKSLIVMNQGLQLATGLYRKLSGMLTSVTNAASVQEDAVNDLNVALRGAGEYSVEASQDLQKFASKLQQTSKFGDEASLSAMALGIQMGKLSGKDLKDATQAAAELATVHKMDLNSAMRMIAKAATDNGSGLKRYGVEVEAASTKAQTLRNAIDAVNKQYGGSALGAIDTYSGAVQQNENAFGDLLEKVGELITTNPEVIQAIKDTTKAFEKLGDWILKNGPEITKTISSIARQLSALTGTNPAAKLQEEITQMTAQVETLREELKEKGGLFDIFYGGTAAKKEAILKRIDELNEGILEKQNSLKKIQEKEDKKEEKRKQKIEKIEDTAEEKRKKKAEADLKAWNAFKLSAEQELQQKKGTIMAQGFGAMAALAKEGGKKSFAVWKAASLSEALVAGGLAVQKALASAPPPWNFAAAVAVGLQSALNIRSIAMTKPPAFEYGGYVGGTSYSGDKVHAMVNSGELILNNREQKVVSSLVGNNTSNEGLIAEIRSLKAAILNRPLTLVTENLKIAQSVNEALKDGYQLVGA